MTPCNNISTCHSPVTIAEDHNAMRVICTTCKVQYVIRKDWRGAPEKRAYAQIFRKDVLQGVDNLFYKYYPEHLRT